MPKRLLEKARSPAAAKNWAVVIPAELPYKQQIISTLAPLIDHRSGMIMELRNGHDPAIILEFCSRLAYMPVEERPYFLLLVGGLDDLSIEFQYFLQCFGGAGRLHFESVKDYACYAGKVIRYEAAVGNERPATAFAATDTDDVAALNSEELARPLAEEFTVRGMPPILADGRVTKARLLELSRKLPERSILFLAAHGYERRAVPEHELDALYSDQRAFQGAPILDDFAGRRRLGDCDGLLCMADLAGDVPFVPGGAVVLHACYSAGTAERDTLPEWIHIAAPPRLAPQRPFISQLCQAMLASPAGPIAVYGHINRSHQYAYFDPDGSGEPLTRGHYRDLLMALIGGHAIALGRERARRMTIRYMYQARLISRQISTLLAKGVTENVSDFERSFVQYSFGSCNFRSYIILGDPMVHLTQPPTMAD